MRRLTIFVAWAVCATIPAAIGTVLLFGCCALPFHQVVHRIFPICGGIAKMLINEPLDHATPAKTIVKQAPVVLARGMPKAAVEIVVPLRPLPLPQQRDLVSLGALRCDDDVGLHLLLLILLI